MSRRATRGPQASPSQRSSTTAFSVSVNPSIYGFLQGAKDASFLGNSWAEECVVGLTQLAPSQGEGNWERVPGALVRDWCVTDCCCKPLSQEALALLVLWVKKIVRHTERTGRIHIHKAQRLLSTSLGWRNVVPGKGSCKHSSWRFGGKQKLRLW